MGCLVCDFSVSVFDCVSVIAELGCEVSLFGFDGVCGVANAANGELYGVGEAAIVVSLRHGLAPDVGV